MSESGSSTIQPFLEYLKFEKRYSPHTLTSYEDDLSAFFTYLKEEFEETAIALPDINHNHIRSWLASLKEDDISSKSINRKISSLRSFFKYYLKREVIQTMPTAKIIAPKVGKRLPVFVKESETSQLMETLNSATEDWTSLNAKMLINLFYATGMRLTELITMKEKQVDKARSQLKILGKGNKERIIPVSREIIELIEVYEAQKRKEFGEPDDYLLLTEKGKKLYPKYAWRLVNKYLGMASTVDKKSPHVLRHTFATHLMNNGADLNAVKELLGHASLAATQIYTHNSIEKLKDIHKKAHPKA